MAHPPLTSTITAVTVFVSGAQITRTASLAGAAGRPGTVRITGLPLGLDDSSVRVRAEDGEVQSAEVTVQLEHTTAETAAPAEPATLVAAREAVARATLAVEVAEHQLERLEGIVIAKRPRSARGTSPPAIPTQARLGLLAFKSARAAAVLASLGQLRTALTDAQERLTDEEHRFESCSSARAKRLHELSKCLLIALRWTGASTAGQLVVTYRVPAARWVPSYVLTLNPTRTSAALAIKGSVAQATGEDWTAARITLSTAEALSWCRLPELTSLRIGRRQEAVRSTGWREPPVGAAALFADLDAVALPALQQHPRSPAVPMGGPADRSVRDQEEERDGAKDDVEGGLRMKERSEPVLQRSGPAGAVASFKAATAASMAAPPASAPAPVMADLARLGAPPPSVAKPKRMANLAAAADKKRMRSDDDSFGGSSAESAPSEAAAADHPAETVLEYGQLRMRARHEGGDGSLTAVSPQEQRLRSAAGGVDPAPALQAMRGRQAELGRLPIPVGCSIPSLPQFAYAYPAVGQVTIPSDGRWHTIALGEVATPARIAYICVPREDRQVFTIAHLTNTAAVPLLAGPVDILIGADYLLTAALPVTVAGGTLELGLGVEQGISVARNTTYAESAAGLLNGSLTLSHGITIELANKLRLPITIEVRERLPVPAEGQTDCKVKLGAVTPPWKDYRQDQEPLEGGHAWTIDLAAGATQLLSASYQITIPAKAEIAGGNRREA